MLKRRKQIPHQQQFYRAFINLNQKGLLRINAIIKTLSIKRLFLSSLKCSFSRLQNIVAQRTNAFERTLLCDVVRYYVRFLVVQNLKIAESSVFIFSKLFD